MARCITEGRVRGDTFAVDASLIQVEANRQRAVTAFDWKAPTEAASRSVREYLDVLSEDTWAPRLRSSQSSSLNQIQRRSGPRRSMVRRSSPTLTTT